MATIPIIQLLRNNNIYSSRDAARSALEGQKNNVPDGGVILARYSGTTGEEQIIKTLAGFVSNISTSENATVTIIDVEGAAENVQDAITSAINKLNKEDTTADGQYVSSVSEENGIIKVTHSPLPSVEKSVTVGEAVTAVTQTNGKIGVEYGNIDAYKVSLADVSGRFDSDNVEGALVELHTSLNEAMGVVGMMIDGKINAINSSPSSQSQHIIVSLNQNNGRIDSVFVKEYNIASASLLGTTSDTKDNETAFGYIAKEVAAREDAIDALSTSSTVTLENADGTEGILKVYTIKQGDREVGKINIPKDLVVTSGSVVKGTWTGKVFKEEESGNGTALKLVIANQEAPVYINTLDLVKDHTAGSGIAISDTNVISVKIDGVSEEFLTVGENGVKLSGVTAAINKANTKVAKDSSADKITLTPSTAADGSVTYTIGQNDIASEAALTAEVNDRQSADTTLQNNIDNVNSTLTTHTADNVVHITQAEREKWNTPTDLSKYYTKTEVDSKVNDINSTIESYGHVTSQALNDLGTRLDDYGKVTSQSLNDLSTKFGDYYNKQEVDAAIANVDVTSQLANYYTKSETSSSTQINDALELKANKTDVEASLATKLDSTAYTPTDLSNYYNKQEIDAAVDLKADKTTVDTLSGNVDTLSAALDTYEEVTAQSLNDINTALDTYEEVTAQSLNDLSDKFTDYYNKEFVDALIARIVQLETKIGEMENNGVNAGNY